MKDKIFNEGMILLSTVFKGVDFSKDTLKAYRRLLDDLQDKDFEEAIIKMCKEVKEIYPGTNIIAIIREIIRGPVVSPEKQKLLDELNKSLEVKND